MLWMLVQKMSSNAVEHYSCGFVHYYVPRELLFYSTERQDGLEFDLVSSTTRRQGR